MRFATSRMPNFVERVSSAKELAAVQAKAAEWGLPLALVLSKSGATSSTLKSLSTEYRRRLIIAEHKAGSSSEWARQFGVTKLPAILGLRAGAEPVRFEKEPTFNRLSTFFGKLALRKPVLKKPQPKDEL